MSRELRWTLTAIVLVNLAFVHATEDASLVWLAPLYLVTLLSQALRRWSARGWYRWTWNIAALAIFGVLVRDTLTKGPEHLLEDGLRLAAVCQVHVLANLGGNQKPDLLFFNSFLIAVVTAYLTQDTVYSVVFAVYAALLVLGLALYASPEGAHGDRTTARRVIRDSALRTVVVLVVTFAAFAVVPRDFQRRGLVVETITAGPAALQQVGFTETVRVDRGGQTLTSNAIVMKVRPATDAAALPPVYWRGATQLEFDGAEWKRGPALDLGDRWTSTSPRVLERTTPAPAGTSAAHAESWSVELLDPAAGIAFAPLHAARVRFAEAIPSYATPVADGTVRFPREGDGRGAAHVNYEIDVVAPSVSPSGAVALPPPSRVAPALRLPGRARVPAIAKLAAGIRKGLAADAPQFEIAQALSNRLSSRGDYMLPGTPGEAADLTAFVEERGGGHCEQFATTLALMLRNQQIPCRVVTGFASDEWDDNARTLTIRQRHAHSWVEVFDPTAGWYELDPTPSGGRAAFASASWGSRMRDWAAGVWESIIRFDGAARDRVIAWFGALPAQVAALLSARPTTSVFGIVALLTLLCVTAVVIRRRRLARTPATVRTYLAAVRAAVRGREAELAPVAGETPREFLRRACLAGLTPQLAQALEAATAAHEAARFSA